MKADAKPDVTPGGRTLNGRFAPGGPGGPGRPRAAIEREYLRVVAAACPPHVWERVVARAAQDAEAGDSRAREFLARYLVGAPQPDALLQAAVLKEADITAADEVAAKLKELQREFRYGGLLGP